MPREPETKEPHPQAPSPTEPELTPVFLEGINGRSGSTVLMRILGTAPAMIVPREHPHEAFHVSFLAAVASPYLSRERWRELAALEWPDPRGARWRRVLRKLDGLRSRHRSPSLAFALALAEPARLRARELLLEEARDPSASSYIHDPDAPVWASLSRSGWDRIARAHLDTIPDEKRTLGRYAYAEKIRPWMSELLADVLGARRILRLRDPRDVWASILSFDAQRGWYGFLRAPFESRSEYLERFLIAWRRYLTRASDPATQACVVRYEDLLEDPDVTVTRLASHLQISIPLDEARRALTDRPPSHATSASLAASVGRWRRELPRREQRRFSEALGDCLEAHGYPRA